MRRAAAGAMICIEMGRRRDVARMLLGSLWVLFTALLTLQGRPAPFAVPGGLAVTTAAVALTLLYAVASIASGPL